MPKSTTSHHHFGFGSFTTYFHFSTFTVIDIINQAYTISLWAKPSTIALDLDLSQQIISQIAVTDT